ncbi:MAG: hypothetical protein M3Q93_05175 [Gemmatimonadota bacterium]|nr:hypothetical protein [Gemmatimonadota bacterium]
MNASIRELLLACLLLAGCGEPNGFEQGCQSQVSFSVSDGLTPQLGWSPDCKLGLVAVAVYPGLSMTPGERISAEWMIQAEGQLGPDNLLQAPLRYGELPSGAISRQGPQPLVAGGHYVVQGWVYDLEGRPIGAGTTAFRP